MALTLVPITGHISLPDGSDAAGVDVAFKSNAQTVSAGDRVVLQTTKTFTTDSTGHLPSDAALWATDDPGVLPDGLSYQIVMRTLGADRTPLYLNVPHTASSVDLSSATPQPPAPASIAYATQAGLTAEAGRAESVEATLISLTQKAVSDFLGVVASQAAMLALVGQRGDWCVRSDFNPNRTYMLAGDDPTQLANWQQMSFGGVNTVAGRTGDISLVAADVSGAASLPTTSAQTFVGDVRFGSGRPYYDITSFAGVDGTGATKSTNGVLNAINALNLKGGGELRIPPNTIIDIDPGQILIDRGGGIGVTIEGSGATSILRCSSGTGAYIVKCMNSPFGAIRNLQVQVSGTARITGNAVDIDCDLGDNTENVNLFDVVITNQNIGSNGSAINASIALGGTTVTIDPTDSPFTAGHVGGMIALEKAGTGGTALIANITSYISATQVGIDTAASAAVSGAKANYYAGSSAIMVNGFGIGTSPQSPSQDVAEVNLWGCKATFCLHASMVFGGGVSGNVLDNRAFGCEALHALYNVVIQGTGLKWVAGTVAKSAKADFKMYGPAADPILITGVRSENSFRFWECVNNGTTDVPIKFDSVLVVAVKDPSGKVVQHNSCASLTITSSQFRNPTAAASLSFDLAGSSSSRKLTFTAVGVNVQNASDPFGTDVNTVRTIIGCHQVDNSGNVLGSYGNYFDDSVTAKGGMVVGKTKLAQAATDGFLWAPTITGPPTGTPTVHTGSTALVVGDDGVAYYWSPSTAQWVPLTTGTGGPAPGNGVFGDGSDGDVVLAGTTTLVRDMYYNTLTVPAGAILNTASFRICCKTYCWIQTGGTIQNKGGDAVGSVGGTVVAGTLGPGRAGTTGTTGAGTQPAALGSSLGGAGGPGGSGSNGAGGLGGTTAAPAPNFGGLRSLPQVALGMVIGNGGMSVVNGGGGGGAGGGDGTTAGPGGGGGGGVIVIAAYQLIIDGTLSVAGGKGADAGGSNVGGGGGGGGGLLCVAYNAKSGANATLSAAVNCPGGLGGAKTGTGVAGTAGSNGAVREVRNQY